MNLQIDDRAVVDSPSAGQIRDGVAALESKSAEFLILGIDPMTYMQMAHGDSGYVVEYQEGNTKDHFRACRSVDSDTAIQLLLLYQKGNTDWKSSIDWERAQIKPWWKIWG